MKGGGTAKNFFQKKTLSFFYKYNPKKKVQKFCGPKLRKKGKKPIPFSIRRVLI